MAASSLEYVRVNLLGFAPGRPPQLDLYLRVGGRNVLYCRGDEVFTEAAQARLLDNGISDLVVVTRRDEDESEDEGLSLPEILDMPDSHLSPAVKADILYNSALSATRMVFSARSTETKLRAAEHAVRVTTSSLARSPAMLRSVIKVMRHDYSVYTHTVNVCTYAAVLATYLDREEQQIMELSLGAILHDVGKAKVPLAILQKPGPLTDEEWSEIRRHPEAGVQAIGPERIHPVVQTAVMQHHERMDGSGYPAQLEGDDIDFRARAIAVADVFDALTAKRPYRPQLTAFDALVLMKREMANKLDDEMFVPFVKMLGEYGG